MPVLVYEGKLLTSTLASLHCLALVELVCSLCSQDSLWNACCEALYSTSSRYQALRTQCLRPEGLKGLQSWLGAASLKEVYRVRACTFAARAAPLC